LHIFTPTNFKRALFFIILDLFAIAASTYIAFLLRFDFSIPAQYIDDIYKTFFILGFIRISLFYILDIYKVSWRFFSFKDQVQITYILISSTIVFTVLVYLFRGSFLQGYPRSAIPIEFLLTFLFILSSRVSKRFFLEVYSKHSLGKPTLIVASPHRAEEITRKLQKTHQENWPVAIWNDEAAGLKINGVSVKSYEDIKEFHNGIETVIVSNEYEVKDIYDAIKALDIHDIKVFNPISDYAKDVLVDISVEDLLARHPKDLDKQKIQEFVKDKVVMVTGAGGSIGSEICRQCEKYGAKELILLDHSEFNLYTIEQELTEIKTIAVMENIRDLELIDATFKRYKPDIVIHAAAYKHVPLVEANITEAILNNVVGTKNVIDSSIKYGVDKFVMISTDKAVRPTNVMGTTKRICELYAQNSNGKGTDIVAVRFGNVLGSSGSVIPKFKAQIEKGENITVTHPEITRYFMLIPEACELVLQAGAIGSGGEIFILDMGEPIKIVDLAKKMIELSGRDDIKIEFTGLRPGEKLYEELLIDESDAQTQYQSITVAKPTFYDINRLNKDIDELVQTQEKLKKLKEIVPEFNHQPN
jgi:UDP-N-acetyl-D-glucosamine 4,6-dehydratase